MKSLDLSECNGKKNMQAFKAAKCLMETLRRLPLAVGGIAVNSVDDLDVDDLGWNVRNTNFWSAFSEAAANNVWTANLPSRIRYP